MRLLRRLLPVMLLAVAACAQKASDPGGPSEEAPRFGPEVPVTFPAWPKPQDLVEFEVSRGAGFHFFVDAASLSLGSDGIVRYTLLARSASGVANVSYEGMRCADWFFRVYAYGRDGRWQELKADQSSTAPREQRWQRELRTRYFCPNGGSILSVAEGRNALRRGGHPSVEIGPGR